MKKVPNISEAEWPIMESLWDKGSATAAEIVAVVTSRRPAAMRTVKTLIRRLIAKGLVAFTVDEHDSRIYHYRPLISREAGVMDKNRSLLDLVYNNDVGELLANFARSADLTGEEINRLREILKDKEKGGGHG